MKAVLIITASFDPQADLLIAELRRRNVPCVRWNTYEFPLSSVLTYRASSGGFAAEIISDGRTVDLAAVGSIWWQWDQPAGFPSELKPAERRFAEREAELAVNALPTIGDFFWINHPTRERLANSKPSQLFAARAVGLEIPRTVITNNPDEVRRFIATAQRQVVYKALSPPRNFAPDKALFTGLVSAETLANLDLIRITPGIFQERIDKSYELRITVIGSRIFAVDLHAVVVGIQEFSNTKLNLTYPVEDARLFAKTLAKYSPPLFQKVDIQLLVTPAQTTRSALIQSIKDMQAVVGPDDLFVFYVASHGTTDDGEYFLITSNVGSVSTEHLKTDAVSKEELTALVANIPATKKLMVIDTCNAEALGNALLTRGLDEPTALKILSRAVGTTVLAASTSTQEALEGYQGHGLFSYVVAEGLAGKGDVDKDGFVSTFGLAHYVDIQVPDLAQREFNHAQFPVTEISGQQFPLTKVR
jgi:hypothetical protein